MVCLLEVGPRWFGLWIRAQTEIYTRFCCVIRYVFVLREGLSPPLPPSLSLCCRAIVALVAYFVVGGIYMYRVKGAVPHNLHALLRHC